MLVTQLVKTIVYGLTASIGIQKILFERLTIFIQQTSKWQSLRIWLTVLITSDYQHCVSFNIGQ
jgi:hypothetical protein